MTMIQKLVGAYIRAWVWVYAPDENYPIEDQDEFAVDNRDWFYRQARALYQDDGAVEIDEDVDVSYSYEEG